MRETTLSCVRKREKKYYPAYTSLKIYSLDVEMLSVLFAEEFDQSYVTIWGEEGDWGLPTMFREAEWMEGRDVSSWRRHELVSGTRM